MKLIGRTSPAKVRWRATPSEFIPMLHRDYTPAKFKSLKIGVPGVEPGTSRTPSERASHLRYTPILKDLNISVSKNSYMKFIYPTLPIYCANPA